MHSQRELRRQKASETHKFVVPCADTCGCSHDTIAITGELGYMGQQVIQSRSQNNCDTCDTIAITGQLRYMCYNCLRRITPFDRFSILIHSPLFSGSQALVRQGHSFWWVFEKLKFKTAPIIWKAKIQNSTTSFRKPRKSPEQTRPIGLPLWWASISTMEGLNLFLYWQLKTSLNIWGSTACPQGLGKQYTQNLWVKRGRGMHTQFCNLIPLYYSEEIHSIYL